MFYIGIDIGSTSTKTVVVDGNKKILYKNVCPSGWDSKNTANIIKENLFEKNIDVNKARVVATGYGRICVNYAYKTITEISCHANGAVNLFNLDDLFLIDIGGQDTKIIDIKKGKVQNFLMNDKCSAGTGRFLEVMANGLGLTTNEICELARTGNGVKISSMCTVFAESEIISLAGQGEKKENIAFAIIDSITDKVLSMISKFDISNKDIVLTGGLCKCEYLVEVLSRKINKNIITCDDAIYSGAIGAAIFATKIKD